MDATKKLLLLAALVLPASAFANEGGHVDGYYIPSSTLNIDYDDFDVDGSIDGDGFGVKGMVPFGQSQSFFLTGEYQSVSQDGNISGFDIDNDMDQLRLGGGWQVPLSTGTGAIYAEYVDIKQDQKIEGDKIEGDADGFGVHARLAFPIANTVNVYGQVGYLALEGDQNTDVTGFEFLVGASVDFTRNLGAFIDYRHTELTLDYDGPNEDDTLQDLRVGIRVLFNT